MMQVKVYFFIQRKSLIFFRIYNFRISFFTNIASFDGNGGFCWFSSSGGCLRCTSRRCSSRRERRNGCVFCCIYAICAASEKGGLFLISTRSNFYLASISLFAASREHSSSVFSPVEGHATVAGIQWTGDLGNTVCWIANGRALVAARARS